MRVEGDELEFNLLDEEWIPVLPLEGRHVECVGLSEALLNGRRYRRLVGSSPTMTAALHRLLLALLHRVYGPDGPDRWMELWNGNEGLPAAPFHDYRERWEGRFDLFHERHPFFQCPALHNRPAWDARREPHRSHSTAELVAHWVTGSNRTLFDHTTADQRPVLKPDEAARWLVTLQAYDTGGTKTPFNKTKESKRGPANRFACCLLEGRDLHETLLLNTVPYEPGRRPVGTTEFDAPAWEQDPPGPEPDSRLPNGWTDVLTWPSRRALLFPGKDAQGNAVVEGVLRTPGVTMEKDLSPYIELMAAFRQEWLAKDRSGKRNAVMLEGVRGVWRHTQELLLPVQARWHVSWRDGKRHDFPLMPLAEPDRERPAALEHVAEMTEVEDLADDRILTLRVFGQELDPKGGGGIVAWFEEAVPVPVYLLRARDPRLGGLIGHAVAFAADLGDALRAMERHYRESFAPDTGRGRQQPKSRADTMPSATELEYWPRLVAPFADLLRELATCVTNADFTAAGRRWGSFALRTARSAAEEWSEGEPRSDRMLMATAACSEEFMTTSWRLSEFYRTGLAGVIRHSEEDR